MKWTDHPPGICVTAGVNGNRHRDVCAPRIGSMQLRRFGLDISMYVIPRWKGWKVGYKKLDCIIVRRTGLSKTNTSFILTE